MKHLLLVDDDEGNRLTLAALLEDEGFLVDVACSFAQAKGVLDGAPPSYAAILLDHSLGDGYGTELVPVIHRVLPRAKVVAMSGSLGADPMRRGADADLPKGLHFPDFLQRLRHVLGSGE